MYRYGVEGEAFRADLLQGVQASLRLVRLHLDISGQEMADYIGVTRQTINNFEKGHREMGVPYFLALCGLLDELCQMDPDVKEQLVLIIRSKLAHKEHFSGDKSLLSQWFSTFSHLRDYYGCGPQHDDNDLSMEKEIARKAERIYTDKSFLFQEGAADFLLRFAAVLEMYGKYISVPSSVLDELRNCSRSATGRYKERAGASYNAMVRLSDKKLVEVESAKGSGQFVGFWGRECFTEPTAILVGDEAIAGELAIAMKDSNHECYIYNLCDHGELIAWDVCNSEEADYL